MGQVISFIFWGLFGAKKTVEDRKPKPTEYYSPPPSYYTYVNEKEHNLYKESSFDSLIHQHHHVVTFPPQGPQQRQPQEEEEEFLEVDLHQPPIARFATNSVDLAASTAACVTGTEEVIVETVAEEATSSKRKRKRNRKRKKCTAACVTDTKEVIIANQPPIARFATNSVDLAASTAACVTETEEVIVDTVAEEATSSKRKRKRKRKRKKCTAACVTNTKEVIIANQPPIARFVTNSVDLAASTAACVTETEEVIVETVAEEATSSKRKRKRRRKKCAAACVTDTKEVIIEAAAKEVPSNKTKRRRKRTRTRNRTKCTAACVTETKEVIVDAVAEEATLNKTKRKRTRKKKKKCPTSLNEKETKEVIVEAVAEEATSSQTKRKWKRKRKKKKCPKEKEIVREIVPYKSKHNILLEETNEVVIEAVAELIIEAVAEEATSSQRKKNNKKKRKFPKEEEIVREIGPYKSKHKILLLGEGDFSFSASLAVAFGDASNIVATSLNDKADYLLKNYKKAKSNIGKLEGRGASVFHGVDATRMAGFKLPNTMKFDRIIFNFPHSGCFEDTAPSLRRNQALVSGFLGNAKKMIVDDGEIHVTHKTSRRFIKWNIVQLASAEDLHLIEESPFHPAAYPGYHTKFGFGGNKNFPCYPCRTYKFGLACG